MNARKVVIILAGLLGVVRAGLAERPVAVKVLSMDKCAPCQRLVDELTTQSVKITYSKTKVQLAEFYPAVLYSDGVRDRGERIFARQANYFIHDGRLNIEVVKWKP